MDNVFDFVWMVMVVACGLSVYDLSKAVARRAKVAFVGAMVSAAKTEWLRQHGREADQSSSTGTTSNNSSGAKVDWNMLLPILLQWLFESGTSWLGSEPAANRNTSTASQWWNNTTTHSTEQPPLPQHQAETVTQHDDPDDRTTDHVDGNNNRTRDDHRRGTFTSQLNNKQKSFRQTESATLSPPSVGFRTYKRRTTTSGNGTGTTLGGIHCVDRQFKTASVQDDQNLSSLLDCDAKNPPSSAGLL